ncbi:prolyl oligopeptidase family serine peptidase [Elizabethkingia anophelis]|uniref:prolyl oligopeptidase family serine peptidase n=1 Tax=Elizabethkingia anophelis TaxID=1117645 RepID=UPI000C9AF8D6|nr:prolyl oligopeptidase family serine peptidase [Elizabethkingia anophelis]MCT3728504.1 prolyl oligopeptidase family serine peptidase [Elizabethkingia anophelis]MCT3760547.1 prolyl oligopeptidase family serine peptidase [Elizabethkingia anophelis]MCT3975187.1 prolyl oligopeptidase family serine peptidase [Elizabethkingia anophelis]MCT4003704.1 prolyl oligopeptidase family serine peptidase [Elizabethkingia anophelis]MCT4017796.1 prolyl oligopeptidase family serine peptidase [Elizabethkingia an
MRYTLLFLLLCNSLFSQSGIEKSPIVETYFNKKVTDDYRNLEDVKDSLILNWMKTQSTYARSMLQSIPERQYLIDKLNEMDGKKVYSIDNLQITNNSKYFYLKRKSTENISKLYTRDSFDGKEQELFTPNDYKKNNKEYTITYIKPNYDGSKVVIALTEGGKEVGDMIIVDVITKKVSPYIITNSWPANGGVSWLPDGTGFVYIHYPTIDHKSALFLKDMIAVVYKIGDDPLKLHPILSRTVSPELNLNKEDFPVVNINSNNTNYLIGRIGGAASFSDVYYADFSELYDKHINWRPLYKKDDKIVDYTIIQNSLYYITSKNTKNNILAYTSLQNPTFTSSKVLIREMNDEVIKTLHSTKDGLYITTTKNGVEAKLYFYNLKNEIKEINLPISAGSISITTLSNNSSDIWVTCSGWNSLNKRYKYNIADNKFIPENLNPLIEFDEFKSIKVLETTVKSHDGLDIPLSIIYNKELNPKDKLPLLAVGYGAYGISLSPTYARFALLWAVKGGIAIYPHVRGGGEKGEEWHLGGYKKNKPNTWKDFISCIEYMHKKGYSTPEKTAIWGSSAGGLLIGKTITERPNLAKAAIAEVGLMNALRMENSPNGANSTKEFGTVKNKEDFDALYEMDAYHHIKKGKKYPSTLITGGYNDPRVPVWQPAKFAAKLQEDNSSKNPILLKIDFDGGHGIDNPKKKAYEDAADIFAFAFWQLGHPDYQPKGNNQK